MEDTHRQTQYTTWLHLRTWQPDQIVTWQPDKRTRKLGRRRDFIYWGKSEKSTAFWRSHLWKWTRFFGSDSDGMMEGIPLPFFWNSCLHILTGCPLDMEICNLSRIEWYRTREETYSKEKGLCIGHNGGEKITSNYAKIFQTMSAFVLCYTTTLLQLHSFEERETWFWLPWRTNFNRAGQTKNPGTQATSRDFQIT